ncbi:unnamed protein product [Cuscuta europaea]|uniref:Uncharacterized protein n=1 Tax=Cuscuta europaea TaxID=41803 RepID=A0A9P1ECJ2_CUSEU|nr:unnamed protein product [Cuscuta europaea]
MVIFEIKKSTLHVINFEMDLGTQTYHFILQLTSSEKFNQKKIRAYHGYFNPQQLGCYVKIAKEKGSSILVPRGPHNSKVNQFLKLFSNFVGYSGIEQDDPIHWERETTIDIKDITISKLIFNYEVQRTFGNKENSSHPMVTISQS